MPKAILFDLDGTLLPMDMDTFTNGYFALLVKKAASAGYEKNSLVKAIWKGTEAMVRNDGTMTNEERFWQTFAGVYGEAALADKSLFDNFYANEFSAAVSYTQPQPLLAQQIVAAARRRAEKVILATNPIFPTEGVAMRLRWIGLRPDDFDEVTTYENSHFCKPNPLYYSELLSRLGVSPAEAVMVGNDMQEDVEAAGAAGLPCYLVRDCMINRTAHAVACSSGRLEDLPEWLSSLT